MNLNPSDIYPTRIYSGNVSEYFFENDFLQFQDLIENSSHHTHENLKKYQSLPATTNNALFEQSNSESLRKLKKLFEEFCLKLHGEKYPNMSDKLFVHESVCKGLVVNKMTTVQPTQSFYPWHYTGVLIVRTPADLDPKEGGITFIDPTPVSDINDQYGIISKKGNMSVFPSWLKFRFTPITNQSNENDTVMMLIMNCFLTHQKVKDYKEIVEKFADQYEESDLNVLSGSIAEKSETDIGWANSGM